MYKKCLAYRRCSINIDYFIAVAVVIDVVISRSLPSNRVAVRCLWWLLGAWTVISTN